MELDAEGHIVRPEEKKEKTRRHAGASEEEAPREELEGVFVYRDGEVIFTPVKVGISGERYFEVLSGLEETDQVVTGPYRSVRELKDGDSVKVEEGE